MMGGQNICKQSICVCRIGNVYRIKKKKQKILRTFYFCVMFDKNVQSVSKTYPQKNVLDKSFYYFICECAIIMICTNTCVGLWYDYLDIIVYKYVIVLL